MTSVCPDRRRTAEWLDPPRTPPLPLSRGSRPRPPLFAPLDQFKINEIRVHLSFLLLLLLIVTNRAFSQLTLNLSSQQWTGTGVSNLSLLDVPFKEAQTSEIWNLKVSQTSSVSNSECGRCEEDHGYLINCGLKEVIKHKNASAGNTKVHGWDLEMHLYLHSVITDEVVLGSKCIVIIRKSQDGLQANK